MPNPTRPQFPGAEIGEPVGKHVTLRPVGRNLIQSQEAADFPTKLKFRAASGESPYTPYPAPDLLREPWVPHNADVKGVKPDKRYGIAIYDAPPIIPAKFPEAGGSR